MNTGSNEILHIKRSALPERLMESPEPPESLFLRGADPFQDEDRTFLTIVGSRRCTSYGKQACERIVSELQGYNVTIVSGLALGIDAVAHKAALEADLHTMAVPGSGISDEVLYPRSNVQLAHQILDAGGTLLSEYAPYMRAAKWTFPKRNRIMAALSHAVLIVEAEPRSGTLITARLALDYNRELLAVPGSIFSATSQGTNMLLKQGAAPVQSSKDILEALGIDTKEPDTQQTFDFSDCSDDEQTILKALSEPLDRSELSKQTELPASTIATTLTLLEIKGYIKEQGGKIYRQK